MHLKETVDAGHMTLDLWKMNESLIRRYFVTYIGNIQISLVGGDKWKGYTAWRKQAAKEEIEKQHEVVEATH